MALATRCAWNRLDKFRLLLPNQYRCVSLAPQKAQPLVAESHDARNARLLRPQSPHLTIYKFQLTSMLSISHRFTGLALAAYVAGAGAVSLASSQPLPQLIHALQTLDPALIYSAKVLLAFPFAYHFVNGIRHLVWDAGKALTIKGVYTTGYVMLGTSSLLTIVLCAL